MALGPSVPLINCIFAALVTMPVVVRRSRCVNVREAGGTVRLVLWDCSWGLVSHMEDSLEEPLDLQTSHIKHFPTGEASCFFFLFIIIFYKPPSSVLSTYEAVGATQENCG